MTTMKIIRKEVVSDDYIIHYCSLPNGTQVVIRWSFDSFEGSSWDVKIPELHYAGVVDYYSGEIGVLAEMFVDALLEIEEGEA